MAINPLITMSLDQYSKRAGEIGPACRAAFIKAATREHALALAYPEGRSWNMASLDWSQCPAVESVPGKMSGAWVLRGTRMPVAAIFENIEAGASIDDIMEWFDGLDRKQVKAVIEFAVRSLDKVPAHTP
jgi:uncharacterized protein (DUF433 family)